MWLKPTALYLKWPFLWKPVLFGGSIGSAGWESIHAGQIQNDALWGVRLKNRGPQELSQEHQKQLQHSKGVPYNPWDVRGPLEILSRRGQKTSARGLFTTLLNWESLDVHLEFCQQAKAACILAFAPSTDDIQDGKSRYHAQLQFLKFLTPDWWIFLSPKIKVHLFKIALWVNCGLTGSRWNHFGVYHTWKHFWYISYKIFVSSAVIFGDNFWCTSHIAQIMIDRTAFLVHMIFGLLLQLCRFQDEWEVGTDWLQCFAKASYFQNKIFAKLYV